MDDEEAIVGALGLLLTQVRYTRRAVENIERATARWSGVALATGAGAGAAPLAPPPLVDGALKVYVVNLDDLTASGGIGDVLAGLLGGAGRFLGGFFGGVVGGTVSGIAFPYLFAQMARIVAGIERIIDKIGGPEIAGAGRERSAPATPTEPATSLFSQLGGLAETLRLVAQVFREAASGPAPGSPPLPPAVMGPVHSILDLVRAVGRALDGVILLVPMLLGALASFLIRLDDIKLAVVDMLQFALRNVLLLRAAVFAIVLDTLSLSGRLAAGVLGIVAAAVDTVLESVFRVIRAGLETVLAALRIASTGLKTTIDQLMLFLRDGVGALLIFLGDLRIFRLVFHLAEVLPLVLPAIARIMDKSLSPQETTALTEAARIRPPSGGGAAASPAIAAFPDLAAALLPPAAQRDLIARVDALGTTIRAEARTSFGAVEGALTAIGRRARDTVGTLDAGLHQDLEVRLREARGHATTLADSLRAAEAVSRQRPKTGLEAIATAYEDWLGGGGLSTLMRQLTEHFRATPTDATEGGRTIPGRVITGIASAETGRTVAIEIGEVIIDLGEPPAAAPALTEPGAALDPDALHEHWQRLEDRQGIVPDTAYA